MHKLISILFFTVVFHTIGTNASPLNLFVNVTMDDRPDIIFADGDIAVDRTKVTYDGDIRNAYTRTPKWTNGVLPYVIDAGSLFSSTQKTTIVNSMRTIESLTNNCIKFVERTNEQVWLRIFNGSGCWSYMGRNTNSGAQDLSLLTNGCVYTNIVIHELLHAVGFAHEQTRPDRDGNVKINWENIQVGTESNFEAFRPNQVNTLGYSYDHYSVMHYRWNAFSKNGLATIEPTKSDVKITDMGNAATMTTLDIAKVKAYYGCA